MQSYLTLQSGFNYCYSFFHDILHFYNKLYNFDSFALCEFLFAKKKKINKENTFYLLRVHSFIHPLVVSLNGTLDCTRFVRWGSKFETTKCRTADISKIRNFEYWNNESRVIRFFYFRIHSLFLWLFKLFEHSKYVFDNLPSNSKFLNFDSFTNCQIKKIC